jgi:hypothetical protein
MILHKSVSYSLIAQTPANQTLKQEQIWMFSSVGLMIVTLTLVVYGRWKFNQLKKAIHYEQGKLENLQKRLNVALATINKWEANPDLIHSRDCNLDYIRMRMEEKIFHDAIVNQTKVKAKQFISTALRINLSQNSQAGIGSRGGFKIDEIFDITYETDIQGKPTRRVLFRIQIKLMKLPTQSTSSTVNQIIECIENFLSPVDVRDNWQPTIQGHIVAMSWNQKAKPTPLLLLEQHGEGVNVSFRTKLASTYRTLTTKGKEVK